MRFRARIRFALHVDNVPARPIAAGARPGRRPDRQVRRAVDGVRPAWRRRARDDGHPAERSARRLRIWVNALAWLARAYVSLMRGTPLLVQIFVIYYGLPSLGISLDPTPAGVIALSANVAAYMSESMRGAINGIARGQWLAAYSLGLSWGQTLRYVIGPQALRIAVPSLSNSLISLIKDTSLVSVITVTELLRSAQEVIAATYQPLPLYLAAAAVYWVLCQILEWGQRWYEKRLSLPSRH
uniref:Amino acid ABC transporter membrane protein, PAAT family n=1 Tax=Burkholderia orbicola (strain AU 1054) TaxID=331271 RepID=A0A0H2XMN3_BURO1